MDLEGWDRGLFYYLMNTDMSADDIPRKFGKPTAVNITCIFCNYCPGIFMCGTQDKYK
jgi:hypothetical protein